MTSDRKLELKDQLDKIATGSDPILAIWQIGEVIKEMIDALPEYITGIDPAHDQ